MIISFTARPEKSVEGQGIIKWYTDTGYLGDFLEEYAQGDGVMTYNKSSRLYEISFTPNEFWPKTLEEQASAADVLANPDDDGNYPIDGYVVESKIRLIDGMEVNVWH